MTRTAELETRSADVAARKSLHPRRRRRISVTWIFLIVLAVLAFAFLGWALVSRGSGVGSLVISLFALGAVLALITVRAAISTYAAGARGSGLLALLMALLGGGAAIGAGLAFASAYVLANVVGG